MAPRRVIADSDDEDDDDRPLTPLREDAEGIPPDIEPLSPQLPDTQKPISGTTDQSFFASVYDEQQSMALEQSQLIERIVRQSQKASGSSGEVSLPAKGKGKRLDASSTTNVTSPGVLKNQGNELSLFSDGASGVTTPQKSAPGEWDVPSSAEGTSTPRTAKNSKGKREKSYGKQKGTQSKMFGSPAAVKMFMGNDATHEETVHGLTTLDETLPRNDGGEPSPEPATKRKKVSLYDSVPHEAPAPTNFYIAQSNLTTMQKLEYQRVNVTQNSYSGLPVSLPNPKSSGVSTVAYSTPSRYASSSGPPLPWERGSMADTQLAESPDVMDITSSPDIIAAGHGYAPVADMGPPYIPTNTVSHEVEAPIGDSTMGDPPNKKRKKRSKDIQDEDELVQDQSWDPSTIDDYKDNHKRRRPNEDDGDIELIIHPPEEEPPQEIERGDLPREDVYRVDEPVPEMPATELPIPPSAPEPVQLEAQPVPPPKKRGRKKKQPANEQVVQDELPVENQATAQEPPTAAKGSEIQVEPEKPKKKRGRPRKSDPAKSEALIVPEFEPIDPPKTLGNDDESEGITSERTEAIKKSRRKPQAQRKEGEDVETNEPAANVNRDRDVTPLKEISSNTRTPSKKSTSAEAVPTGPAIESLTGPNLPPKSLEKGHTTPKPTPTPTPTTSQPKVPYRVGLSKRTRIASLLKIIKR
ncbi:hypothetical protein F4781DRAFT_277035 [Annulohypoxylon bovei var. microspora]|nr:hypothetical protein F4781DRAFT_277035 [Annulohypoxylon bovei var. microspora]